MIQNLKKKTFLQKKTNSIPQKVNYRIEIKREKNMKMKFRAKVMGREKKKSIKKINKNTSTHRRIRDSNIRKLILKLVSIRIIK